MQKRKSREMNPVLWNMLRDDTLKTYEISSDGERTCRTIKAQELFHRLSMLKSSMDDPNAKKSTIRTHLRKLDHNVSSFECMCNLMRDCLLVLFVSFVVFSE